MFYVWMYFSNRLLDCYLPFQKNWNGAIRLSKNDTGWGNDTLIGFRALEGQWFIQRPPGFLWEGHPSEQEELSISNRDKPRLVCGNRSIGFLVGLYDKQRTIFKKYLLGDNSHVSIGRNSDSIIYINETFIGRTHGSIQPNGKGHTYTDISTNGTYLNGVLIKNTSQELVFGDVLTFAGGVKMVYLGDKIAINDPGSILGHVYLQQWHNKPSLESENDRYDTSAFIQFHRSPRIVPKLSNESIAIEAPREAPKPDRSSLLTTLGPSLTMVLPMLLGVMITGAGGMLSSGLVMIGTSAILGSGWALVSIRQRKQQLKEQESERIEAYKQYIREMESRLSKLKAFEKTRRLLSYPSAQECADMALSSSSRLWERMPKHRDFLEMRLGLGTSSLPDSISFPPKPIRLEQDNLLTEIQRVVQNHTTIESSPLYVSFLKERIIGILGQEDARRLVDSLIINLSALHSYHDVKIALLCEEDQDSSWGWVRWLPHAFYSQERDLRMVASRPASVHLVLAQLVELAQQRAEKKRAEYRSDQQFLPHIVVFCVHARLLQFDPLLRELISTAEGMTLVMLADSMEQLPKECCFIIKTENRNAQVYTSEGETFSFQMDRLGHAETEMFARKLAPVRVLDTDGDSAIPSAVSFFDLYNINRVEDLDVWRLWNENQVFDGICSKIGIKGDGESFVLDISERYHGPHGLIGGTTGSGKSVLIQSFVLSLALNYHPDQVCFALIDFKGGGTSDVFRALPHLVGIIDNLQSERTIQRALYAVQSEIRRREEILRRARIYSIDEYIQYTHYNETNEKMPHLIIVVDEFAELKKEQPDFMRELISLSRIGRSVGIHLVLATQKPSNSVDDEIWSNSRFKICLRVESKNESMEMLRRPEAAYLKGRGRCYVQVGETFEQVQTAWAGAPYTPDEMRDDEKPYLLDDIAKKIITDRGSTKEKPVSQMTVVLNLISETAEHNHVKPARSLWMPELPDMITLSEIRENTKIHEQEQASGEEGMRAVFALGDDPVNQSYFPVYIDLFKDKNYLIVGQSGTGKTSALQTIACALAEKYSPKALQIFALSLSGRGLSSLMSLPHTGDILFEHEHEEAARLVRWLHQQAQDRKALFASSGTENIRTYNAVMSGEGEEQVLPVIVVLIDRLAQLLENLDETHKELLYELILEGSGRGLHFLASAISYHDDLPFKFRGLFTGIALKLHEVFDYRELLNVLVPKDMVRESMPPGRAIVGQGDLAYEVQIGLIAQGQNDIERAENVRALGEKLSVLYGAQKHRGIDRIPEKPTYNALIEDNRQRGGDGFPVGYDIWSGAPLSLELESDFSWLLVGPRASGKSTLLNQVMLTLLGKGAEVHVLSPKGQLMEKVEALHSYHGGDDPAYQTFMEALYDRVAQRSKQLRKEGKLNFPPIALLIDDMDLAIKGMRGEDLEMLTRLYCDARGYGIFVFAAVATQVLKQNQFAEPFKKMLDQRRGIFIGGRINDFDPWDIAIPQKEKNAVLPLRRAYCCAEGRVYRLIIPVSDAESDLKA